jgi:hypothetical protein
VHNEKMKKIIMMKLNYWLISFCVLLLLSSCARTGQPTGAPRNPFLGGTQGLKIEFEKDAPPPEVTDLGFPFSIVLKIKNEGEEKVKQGDARIRIAGFLPGDFGATYDELNNIPIPEELLQKTREPEGTIIEGTTTFLTVPRIKKLQAKPVIGNVPFTFRAEVCYKYTTKAVARLCVLRNLLETRGNKLCDPNGARPSFSSSSPLQVTNFKQHVVSEDPIAGIGRITFTFDIAHKGSGTVYKFGSNNAGICTRDEPSARRDNEDKVFVTVIIPGLNIQPACNFEQGRGPNGYVRLIGGTRTVTCILDMPRAGRTDFETNIEAYLDFNYDQSIEKQVLVKHFTRLE